MPTPGFPVIIKETTQEALDKGYAHHQKELSK